MKKLFTTIISLSLAFMLAFQPQMKAQAAYDELIAWYSVLRVEESDVPAVIEAMKKYASTLQTSYADSNRTIADLLEYFVYKSSVAPYNPNSEYFPDYGYNIKSFSDGEISSTFGAGSQCYAYSNYVESAVYGTHGLRNTYESIPASKSVEDLRNFFLLYIQPGEHIRWDNSHSGTLVLANGEGIYFLNRYYTGEIVLSYYTYSELSEDLIKNDVALFVYNSCPGVNTILPSFSASVNEGVLTIESADYNGDFYIKAGFNKNDLESLYNTSTLTQKTAGGRGNFDIEENFKACPFDGQTLYYQISYEYLGKQYQTGIQETLYRAKTLQNIESEKKTETIPEQAVEKQPESTEKIEFPFNPEKHEEKQPIKNTAPIYGSWSDWQETPIQATSSVEVEKKTVQESVVVGTHKEFNYSYYSYSDGGTKMYTWARDYAINHGGSGERIYRGWGRELMLHTLYDGVAWGSQYVDGGIWFYEEVRDVEDRQTVSKTYYRSRTISY